MKLILKASIEKISSKGRFVVVEDNSFLKLKRGRKGDKVEDWGWESSLKHATRFENREEAKKKAELCGGRVLDTEK